MQEHVQDQEATGNLERSRCGQARLIGSARHAVCCRRCQAKPRAAHATDHDWSHSERSGQVCKDRGATHWVCNDCEQPRLKHEPSEWC